MLATTGLRGFSVVVRDDSAELGFPFDFAFSRGCEINVKNGVADLFSLVRPCKIVMRQPFRINMVQVFKAQANKVVKALGFYGFYECFLETIWGCNQLHLMGNLKHKLFV